MSVDGALHTRTRTRIPSSSGWRRFLRTRAGLAGSLILGALVITALLAPVLAPYSPSAVSGQALMPPGGDHLFGTDNIGRDVLSVVIYGTRSSLLAGIASALIAFIAGVAIGGVAGYFGGWVESVLMRFAELVQTLPALVLALFTVVLFGTNMWLLVFIVAFVMWPLDARLVYGQFTLLRRRPFVDAAVAADLATRKIILSEILPNALPPLMVQVALDGGTALLYQVALGFLGLNSASAATWGQLLYTGQNYVTTGWWISVFPGVAVTLAVIGFSLIGEGLNVAFRPPGHRVNLWSRNRSRRGKR